MLIIADDEADKADQGVFTIGWTIGRRGRVLAFRSGFYWFESHRRAIIMGWVQVYMYRYTNFRSDSRGEGETFKV